MGNCLVSSSPASGPAVASPPPGKAGDGRTLASEATSSSVVSTVSAVSTKVLVLPQPISNEFVASASPLQSNLEELLLACSDPQSKSFVVVNARSGLVVISVTQSGDKKFTVSTPDGRAIGHITYKVGGRSVSKRSVLIEMPAIGYTAASADGLAPEKVTVKLLGTEICKVEGTAVRSIQRGVDLCMIFVLIALNRHIRQP